MILYTDIFLVWDYILSGHFVKNNVNYGSQIEIKKWQEKYIRRRKKEKLMIKVLSTMNIGIKMYVNPAFPSDTP